MNATFNVIVLLFVAIIVLIVVVYITFKNNWSPQLYKLSYVEGLVKVLNIDICQSINMIPCYGLNSAIPYQRPMFPSLDQFDETKIPDIDPVELPGLYFGAKSLQNNQAMVIYGNIPYKYLYWGITGYLYDYVKNSAKQTVFTPIGDSISSSIVSGSFNSRMAVVMTSNYQLFSIIKKHLQNEWKEGSMYINTIVPIYIPPEMTLDQARYTMLIRTIINTEIEEIPPWKCRFYTSVDIPIYTSGPSTYARRSMNPSERQFLSEDKWTENCSRVLVQHGITESSPIKASPFLSTIFPDGFDNGSQIIQLQETVNAQAATRDCTTIISDDITLTSEQELIIFAVDHAKTGKGLYSSISFQSTENDFEYINVVTGNIKDVGTIFRPNKIILRLIRHDPSKYISKSLDGSYHIKIIERIFINPNSACGPDPKSLLYFQSFIAPHSQQLPSSE